MLINNAGLAVLARLEDYSNLDLFRHTLGVNFYGAVYCTYYARPYLKQSSGRIVAVSSLGGKMHAPYNSAYVSSKFAMHGKAEVHLHGTSLPTMQHSAYKKVLSHDCSVLQKSRHFRNQICGVLRGIPKINLPTNLPILRWTPPAGFPFAAWYGLFEPDPPLRLMFGLRLSGFPDRRHRLPEDLDPLIITGSVK